MRKILAILGTLGVAASLLIVTTARSEIVPFDAEPLHIRMEGKSREEKAKMKSKEIEHVNPVGTITRTGIRAEIQSVSAINGGVEVFARAWKDNQPVGFGDGTVEIERFRFLNPPVLVDDVNGDIVREHVDRDGILIRRVLREDPAEALRQSVANAVRIIGKDGSKIIPGKIGHTSTTFYPDANVESTSVDGEVGRDGVNEAWSTIHDGAGNASNDSADQDNPTYIRGSASVNQYSDIIRSFYLFDTSALGASATITSATMSVKCYSKNDNLVISPTYNVFATTPASSTAIANADYQQVTTTGLSTAITYANMSTTGYNDWAINDLTTVSKTAITKYGLREATYDAANVDPATVNWVANSATSLACYFADTAGTTSDPTLVVVTADAAKRPKFTPKNIIMSLRDYFSPLVFAR